jgi:hypothetical protein
MDGDDKMSVFLYPSINSNTEQYLLRNVSEKCGYTITLENYISTTFIRRETAYHITRKYFY